MMFKKQDFDMKVIIIDDIFFSDMTSNNSQPEFADLTEEEKKLIQMHRQHKIEEQQRQSPENFYTKPASYKSPTAEIPALDDDYFNSININSNSSNDFYSRAETAQQPRYGNNQYAQNTYGQNAADDYEYEDINTNRNTAPKRKVKKGCGCGCLGGSLVALFLAIVIAFTGTFGYIYSLMGKTKKEELIQSTSSSLLKSSDVMNILLIGLDEDQNGTSRSDTMMLMSIDKAKKAIKLTSFLRDMWVDIPNHKSAKLNASYAYGGPQLTVDTIETNFNINIDHFMLVNFDMFKQIIDALGGINVEITEKEAKFINDTTSVTVKSGINRLNGAAALVYARIRKLDSDFFRTQRQRKVISSIIKQAAANPFSIVTSLSDIMPLITTDISAVQLTTLALSALKYIKFDIETIQVPADDAYKSKKIHGQSALVPDMEKNKSNIKQFIYG